MMLRNVNTFTLLTAAINIQSNRVKHGDRWAGISPNELILTIDSFNTVIYFSQFAQDSEGCLYRRQTSRQNSLK